VYYYRNVIGKIDVLVEPREKRSKNDNLGSSTKRDDNFSAEDIVKGARHFKEMELFFGEQLHARIEGGNNNFYCTELGMFL